jgi:plastocyanin
MQLRPTARLALSLALVASLACLAPASAAAATHLVDMDNSYAFFPPTQPVARGDTVRWRIKGSLQHDVKSNLSGYFKSPGGPGGLGVGDTYDRTFKQAGSFGYFCRLHELDGMKGTIVVPIKVVRSGGTFTITVASVSTSGTRWRNRIQVRKPGASTWTTLTTTTSRSTVYTTSKHGTFRFRSSVKDAQTGATSGWSPEVTKTRP